ncbi:unnamed protein product [Camellia sinensis]
MQNLHTITECLAKISTISGVSEDDDLLVWAARLFMKPSLRESFMALPNDVLRLKFINLEIALEKAGYRESRNWVFLKSEMLVKNKFLGFQFNPMASHPHLDDDDDFGGEFPGTHTSRRSGNKRSFEDLEDEEDDIFGSKKANSKVEETAPGVATGMILSLRESLQNCKDTLATCQLVGPTATSLVMMDLEAAKAEIQKWYSSFQNESFIPSGTSLEPKIVISYLQSLKSSEESLREQQLAQVMQDFILSYYYHQLEKTKKKEAAFIVTFAKREQEIAELKIRDLRVQLKPPSMQISLHRYNQYLYDGLILFSPAVERFGGSIDLAAIMDFVDAGYDLIMGANSSASNLIREIAPDCGVDFDEDPGAMVIDHISYAVSDTDGNLTLIASAEFIQPEVLLGSKKIEAPDVVEVDGCSMSTLESPIIVGYNDEVYTQVCVTRAPLLNRLCYLSDKNSGESTWRNLVEEKDKKVKELQDNVAAVNFTPQSKMGKMLMSKCRTLQEENEEIGNQANEGKIHELGMKLALQRSQNAELRSQFEGLCKHMEGLANDVEKSNEMVIVLQKSLEEKDDEIERLKHELHQRSITEETTTTEVAALDNKVGHAEMLSGEAQTEN